MTSSTTSPNDNPIFFWRETEKPYGFLSQWYPFPFTASAHPSSKSQDLMIFVTTEQYMMYHKAILFKDLDIAAAIMKEKNPRKHKALGRKVGGFNDKIWNAHREKIVEDGNWYKFNASQGKHEDWRQMLLDTEQRLLVEASPYDTIWGIGFTAANAESSRAHWGLNLLGKALMRVRDRLREEEYAQDST